MLITNKINNFSIKILQKLLPADIFAKIKQGGFRKYFKNTVWLFFGRIFTLIFSFFVGIYIARYLGPENYGTLNYVMSFVLIFSFIPALGVDGILTKELVSDNKNRDKILGTGFIIKFISGILAVIIVTLVSCVINKDLVINLLVFFYSFSFIFQAFNVLDLWFSSQVLSKFSVLSQLFATFLSAIIKLIFIYFHLGIQWILLAFVFDSLFLTIGLIVFFKKNNLKFNTWRFDKSYCLFLLKISWPLMLSNLFGVIFLRIDQIMLKFYLGVKFVGIYSAAAKLSEVMYFMPGLLVASLLPAIVKARNINFNLFESRLKHMYLMMLIISLAIALVVFVCSDFLVNFIFGSAYQNASSVLKIYIWSLVPIFLGNVVNQYLVIENYTKISLFFSVISAVINIVLNLLLIPKYGMVGAAWATFFAAFSMIFFLVFFKQTRRQLYLICHPF